jgi:hypothetical protein
VVAVQEKRGQLMKRVLFVVAVVAVEVVVVVVVVVVVAAVVVVVVEVAAVSVVVVAFAEVVVVAVAPVVFAVECDWKQQWFVVTVVDVANSSPKTICSFVHSDPNEQEVTRGPPQHDSDPRPYSPTRWDHGTAMIALADAES